MKKIKLHQLGQKIRYCCKVFNMPKDYIHFQEKGAQTMIKFEDKDKKMKKFFGDSKIGAVKEAEKYARNQVKDGKAEEPKFIKKRKKKKEESEEEDEK